MDKPIELQQGETYIFQKRIGYAVDKVKIIEITETSIYVEYVDRDVTARYDFRRWNIDWKPIEVI